jgi:uncharacterized protein (TIGR03118 family)
MQSFVKFLCGLICLSILPLSSVHAQASSYKLTPLVSEANASVPHVDPNLLNPWGICFIPGQPFWVSDNNSGFTTLYSFDGTPQGTFRIAPPKNSSNPATPTGCVANSVGGFNINGNSSLFIFDNEDGTISGWVGAGPSILAADNSAVPTAATGAVYKGLTLISNAAGRFLLATNFRSGKVEIYDTNFQATQVLGPGAFNDPAQPAVPAGSGSPGYAPFGIHAIDVNGTSMVVVTYALQDTPMHDPLPIAGAGFVDLFAVDGTLVRRITSDSHLNAPWGAVIPPKSFGPFGASSNLLVGNFGDGVINAYNFATGAFVDSMKDQNGAVITNAALWDLVFDSSGKTGDPNTMFITAGLANEQHGLFAAITANAAPTPPTADFNISASPATLTIAAGQTASFTVNLNGLNGFNSAVNLSCSGLPANSSCSFSPASVTPPSGGTVMSTLKISSSSSPYMPASVIAKNPSGGLYATLLPIPALVLLGLLSVGRGRNESLAGKYRTRSLVGALGLLLATTILFVASGCGGYNSANNNGNGTQRGTATVMITGTSNGLTHSTSVTLTVQ